MVPTKLLYLEDFTILTDEATIVETTHVETTQENDRTVVILDQTIFYPQGGGQPYDQGIIENANGKFLVEEVRFVDGVVKHIGKFERGSFQNGETVNCVVNKERRELHCRLHSGGHVVDMAVSGLGLSWTPGKGFHFPEGPYVEYNGSLEGLDVEKLKTDLENLCNRFIQEGRETKLLFMEKNEMSKVCHFVQDYIPEGKPGRVVMYGDFGIPCGGTHVANISAIKSMTIRKIKSEKGNIRISYDVVR